MDGFKEVKNILIMKFRHIGDVLLTVPAIRAVRNTFPQARICVLVNSGTEDMLTLNPLIDEVICFDRGIKRLPLWKRLRKEIEFIKILRSRHFDMTVDLTGGDRPAITGFLCGARYRLGYSPDGRGLWGKRFLYTHLAPPVERKAHTVLKNLELLRHFRMDTGDTSVDIHTSEDDERFVDGLVSGLERFVHIHPTSRWLFKCWKDEYMALIIDRIVEEGIGVVVTSAPERKEMERIERIKALTKRPFVDLSGRLRLKHLAVLSKRALFFLGVDSAPMHIAASVDTPVVAIFGPSGAFEWGPWNNTVHRAPYPRTNGIQRWGMHTVIQLDWECIPCGRDGCNGSKRSDCLDALSPDTVWEIVKEYITGSAIMPRPVGRDGWQGS